jgi:hypothetical protein
MEIVQLFLLKVSNRITRRTIFSVAAARLSNKGPILNCRQGNRVSDVVYTVPREFKFWICVDAVIRSSGKHSDCVA